MSTVNYSPTYFTSTYLALQFLFKLYNQYASLNVKPNGATDVRKEIDRLHNSLMGGS
jgi:hypothetical protein